MTARQLPLDLPHRPALDRSSLTVTPANRLAVAALDRWRDWPGAKLLLTGAEGSGKSHLARIWRTETGADLVPAGTHPRLPAGARIIVEDADRIAGDGPGEVALLHLHDEILAQGGRLLLTARRPAAAWGLRLPDLASRMLATAAVALGAPDDDLLAAVLRKLLADRQLLVPAGLIGWLVPRMPRSHAAAAALVARLDSAALAQGGPVSRPMAQAVLDSLSPDTP